MIKKQLFAQVGVFLLLGLNVAAYWFLWPNYHQVSSNEGKTPTQEKGVTRLVPEGPAKSAPPKELPPSSLKDAVPLSLPILPAPTDTKTTPEQETISKLFDQIKKDSVPTPPQVTLPLEAPPTFPTFDPKKDLIPSAPGPVTLPNSPKPLPILPAEPLHGDNGPATAPVAVASALTPKMQPSPWLLHMEMIGVRTQLLAKVRQPGTAKVVAEFTIQCDRVEMKAPGGELQALGKVTIVGAGLNATCGRLILPIHETRLVFEERAQFSHDAVAGSVLRGDRISWELPASAAPAVPNPFALPGLGSPK